MNLKTLEDIKKAFLPLPTSEVTEGMKNRIQKVEFAFVELAHEVIDLVPESADRTAALRKVIEAKFTCVQAITHNNQPILDTPKPSMGKRDMTKKKIKKISLYCYVSEENRRFAVHFGRDKFGSFSAYVNHLIQRDRVKNHSAWKIGEQ